MTTNEDGNMVEHELYNVYQILSDLGLEPILSEKIFMTQSDGIEGILRHPMLVDGEQPAVYWSQDTGMFTMFTEYYGTVGQFLLGERRCAKSVEDMKAEIDSLKKHLSDDAVFMNNWNMSNIFDDLE